MKNEIYWKSDTSPQSAFKPGNLYNRNDCVFLQIILKLLARCDICDIGWKRWH